MLRIVTFRFASKYHFSFYNAPTFRFAGLNYKTTAEAIFHYYVKPQATGNRTDVRWVSISDTRNRLMVAAKSPFQFSVTPFSDSVIDRATHINQLSRDGLLTVHLDANQSGVGTATCGPGVAEKYRVPVKPTSFEFVLYPAMAK